MPEIDVTLNEDGTTVLSVIAHTQVRYVHECFCGAKFTIYMQLPEGVEYNGQIILNTHCPVCLRSVIIPHGHHYIEEGLLLSY